MQRFFVSLLRVLLWLSLGALPSLLFFFWIERNCALPWLPIQWGWPWMDFSESSLAFKSFWNVSLILLFGLIHSACAQKPFGALLRRAAIPLSWDRTLYWAITGVTCLGVMGFWQSTGVILWAVPLSAFWLGGVSLTFFGLFMTLAVLPILKIGTGHFLGLKPSSEEGGPLIQTGIYSRLRHPIYFFTILAVTVTPFLTFDRALVLIGFLLYLLGFGIRWEERKLRGLYGEAYDRYREKVPALFPRLF